MNAEETKTAVRKVTEVQPTEPSPFDETLAMSKKKGPKQPVYRQVTEKKADEPKMSKADLEAQQQALLYFEEQKKQHAAPQKEPVQFAAKKEPVQFAPKQPAPIKPFVQK